MKINISKPDISYLKFPCILLCIILLTNACEVDTEQTLEERNYKLTWSDEFNGEAGESPDPTKWTYDIGTGDNGWGNEELQYYTDRPENVSMDGEGNLVITAIRETFAGSPFTSARIKTKGLFEQTYGKFEARMKLPYGPGMWPAFWMLGSDIDTNPWPGCGEIDIMELRGHQPDKISGTIHGPGYSARKSIAATYGLQEGRFDTEFHVFGVEWEENRIDFFVDGFLYARLTPEDVDGEWVFDSPFFMLLNVAVGGTYVGFPTSGTEFPQKMVIDYVRVYQ